MYSELITDLRKHAEWAEANSFEVPIILPCNLRYAADVIERLSREVIQKEVELVELTGELASKPNKEDILKVPIKDSEIDDLNRYMDELLDCDKDSIYVEDLLREIRSLCDKKCEYLPEARIFTCFHCKLSLLDEAIEKLLEEKYKDDED